MTINKLLKRSHIQKMGEKAMVVVPLGVWRNLESKFEDLIMMESKTLERKILKARSEKELHPSSDIKKSLGL